MINTEVTRPSQREVLFTRHIAAPVDLVWEIWTDVKHLHEWYGPAGFTTTTQEFAFTPGGVWRFIMHSPKGTDNPNIIVFRTIEPQKRIVYANTWDADNAPVDFVVEVTLAPEANGTRLNLCMTFANDEAMKTAVELYGVLQGGVETFERIAVYVER